LITAALIAGMIGCDGVANYSLTMAVAGGDGTATDLTNAAPYPASTPVTIKALHASCYRFVGWTASAGTFVDANAPLTTFVMPSQDAVVTANFIQSEPIPIQTWYDLDAIRDELSSCYLLMNDLDSTTAGYEELAGPTANGGNGWDPVGNIRESGDRLTGTLDGQGYEIRGLSINRPGEDDVGLFGAVGWEGIVEDIGVVNSTVTGRNEVGSLAGFNEGTLSNSYATGTVVGNFTVGGLVGWSGMEWNNNGTVSNSYFTGNVTGYNDIVGGLVGRSWGTVSNSYATGDVSGNFAVGSLVGFIEQGNVSDSYSAGSVTGEEAVGGLVGFSYGNVSNSYSTGSVTGDRFIGGLVGCSQGSANNSYSSADVSGNNLTGGLVGLNQGAVSNSYASGSVAGNDHVGGLVGWNYDHATVSNSYSRGTVTGTSFVGGLVGENAHTSSVSNSFWDTETSGQSTSDGGIGKNTTEMKDINTFSGAGWNIITVALNETNLAYAWNIVNNVTYPFLSWEPV